MILIVDFGSQTAHLIGRRLRQLGAKVEYANPEAALKIARKLSPEGIIFSGGPSSVYDDSAPTIEKQIYKLGVPILGICYGWQLMASQLGGEVRSARKEYGPEVLKLQTVDTLYKGLNERQFSVYMSHGDTVTRLPEGFRRTASTDQIENASVANKTARLYGVQFHPEAYHTHNGVAMLRNFVENICGLKMEPQQLNPEDMINQIRQRVGDQKVVCAVSGGVDSTVAAVLIGKAIGQNLIPVYVDSGLMRAGTDKLVTEIFTKNMTTNLKIIRAKERFLRALKGVTDPEIKRKTIGKLYIDIFNEQATKHSEVGFLAQGTIYSDVIESKGSKHASHIKSHHNVGGLPKELKYKLLEPLRTYYKDEVRMIGRMLGLPEEVVMQQPFPGPGYAVRIRGEVTPSRLEQVKQADQIVVEEIKKAGWWTKVFQCFAVMTGAYSTAVKGDARAFLEVVAIRCYESEDVMTSQWSDLPREVLARISSRIVNEVPNVSRVVYDITTKPPATMEWE